MMKRSRTEPPSLITPRSAMKRAASVTVLASRLRTAKYPLSEASSEPERPPMQRPARMRAPRSDGSSPSLRAISAIDRSIMTLDIVSSTGSVTKPKAPPAAPDAVARALCRSFDAANGFCGIVSSANWSASARPLEVAVAVARDAEAGSANPMSSTGLPTRG